MIRRLVPICLWLAVVLLAPVLTREPPERRQPFAERSASSWLGTDLLGSDVLHAVLTGGPVVLGIAAVISVLVTGTSAVVGILAGLYPRLGRLVDSVADALILVPPLIGVLLVVLAWPTGGIAALLAATVLFGVPYCSRVIGSAAAAVASTGYVEASRAGGETTLRLVTHEVLPNMLPTVLTQLGLRFTEALYVVTAVAFLSLPGVLDEDNWAVMVRENAPGVMLNPWGVAAPSLCLLVTVVLVNAALVGTKERQ